MRIEFALMWGRAVPCVKAGVCACRTKLGYSVVEYRNNHVSTYSTAREAAAVLRSIAGAEAEASAAAALR